MLSTRAPSLISASLLVASSVLLLSPLPAAAQDATIVDPPAHVSFVDGTAVIERDGKTDNAPTSMPLLAGDRVRTETGRVEILYADGSLLHLDNFTTVDFQSDEVLRVLDGRVRLTISGRSRDVSYRLDAPNAWAQITQPGEYRLAILRRDGNVDVELAVLRGGAELVNEDGRTPLRAGERAFARAGEAPSYAYVVNSAAWDAFDRWSEARRDYRLGLSTQYLPDEIRPYSRVFDSYGSWRYEQTYGYVWYPTVAVGWRPYYYGRWASLRPYGWVWVGSDPWGWPTHHYGRWGFSAGSWFWIPGRTWGAAWVSWAYAPGYVSWCPLGWNNRPVFQIVNVNVYRGYDPWRAWTVVPRHHFGVSYVNRAVVGGHGLDLRVRNAFEARDTAPDFRGYAVPRSTSAIRVAGTAVPRGGRVSSSPVYTNLDPDAGRVRAGSSRIQMGTPGEGRGTAVPRTRVTPGGDAGTGVPQNRAEDNAPRQRAIPRPGDGERPRMTPDRGVRSLPPVRIEPLNDPPPAVRERETGEPRETREAPAFRRSPAPDQEQRGVPGYGGVPSYRRNPDEGVRPEYGAPGGRAVPRSVPDDRVYGAAPRVPSERRAPDGMPPAPRAIPRERPEGGSPMAPPRIEHRAPPPPPSRSAEPPSPPSDRNAPPARTRPGGDGGGGRSGGGVARRRG